MTIQDTINSISRDIPRPPYYPALQILRDILERSTPEFPYNCCSTASKPVRRYLHLKEYDGFYIPDRIAHTWNYDPERGLYIDLTMDQFPGVEDTIIIIPADDRILKKTRELT